MELKNVREQRVIGLGGRDAHVNTEHRDKENVAASKRELLSRCHRRLSVVHKKKLLNVVIPTLSRDRPKAVYVD
jgi:hypothetical protein